jgi:UDP-N-acetylmuramoylalanine--D-glutamate ligase
MDSLYDSLSTRVPELRGRRALVMGLGSFGGGLGAVRYLARQGARVTVTDLRSEEDLRESLEQIRGLGVELRLGRHDEADFERADLVLFSPAIDPRSPHLRRARERGAELETELNLFFKLCRSRRILGVTGSNGKTTTALLAHGVLDRLMGPRAWLGGNVGISLLDSVDRIAPDDAVVLEISSFQLEALRALRRSPQVAVYTNLSPNHLDRHGSMEEYARAKQAILDHQGPEDECVLNGDDPHVRSLPGRARRATFSLAGPQLRGAWVSRGLDRIRFNDEWAEFQIDISSRKLPGRFNVQNMMAAACASYAICGSRPTEWARACEEFFRDFAGAEHRLEFVADLGGVEYYNDSIATNPDSTIAALEALPGPFVLILGGTDKQLPFERLARKIQESDVRCVVLMGCAAGKIRGVLESSSKPPEMQTVRTLAEAVEAATARSRPGDQVLLSPACASFDQFRNFVERGRTFKRLVGECRRPA